MCTTRKPVHPMSVCIQLCKLCPCTIILPPQMSSRHPNCSLALLRPLIKMANRCLVGSSLVDFSKVEYSCSYVKVSVSICRGM